MTEKQTLITVGELSFREYMMKNHLESLSKEELVFVLKEYIDIESFVKLAFDKWDLPFVFEDGKVKLTDINDFLVKCSTYRSIDDEDMIDEYDEDMYSGEYGEAPF